jgi:hypothetical protein
LFAIALAALAIVLAAFAIVLAAALAALAIAFAALAIVLAAVLAALAALFAALFAGAASPQAIPRAPIARTAESAITFFITYLILLSSSKIRSNLFLKTVRTQSRFHIFLF